ncbi:1-deoxy-D-xylulose-5-phosphate synthase [Desulfurispira natronophila]|uniref:1-deoxy-D-xylulose-5-phosphate synthase n=1 Tax=Desulfurispira natronophila TaxID=682562 RepID=A0A7W7Y420_9BACT|nr:1-deoxy-D-xylulose-5-phosphate synthase [Desulfurispira natronophila]MBB5021680.1 1-deoxy-D-xylulose-5-phosphate synthase [Desulfurispira natronophila]
MTLLDTITGPRDLEHLDEEQLQVLCSELREVIIETTSKVGGHVASNLGVVELTVALHRVFESPADRIIWDVGHQCYPHKLLTGRREQFHTIRQSNGLSGFPKRQESEHDHLDTGHSSTSISAALGMRAALDLKGDAGKVIAVIGDGSIGAGMAFEGLNHAGHLDKDLIIILNDNEMSISENVGALSKYFSKIITGQVYNRFRRDLESMLQSLPRGERLVRAAKRVEEGIKGFMTPGILFEELNIKYFGPVDGHDLNSLMDFLENIKQIDGPLLLHVITRKGEGYAPAEQNPEQFHGVGPYDRKTGKVTSNSSVPSYTAVAGRAVVELGEEDKKVVTITAAMPEGTGVHHFKHNFPDRFFDVGIAEQHAVTFAAGLALQGMHPYVFIYSTFFQRAYDQVIHDVCLQNLPVVFCIDRAGIVGNDGETHNGSFDLSFLRCIPNMKILTPKDENELYNMLLQARSLDSPVTIRYARGSGFGVEIRREPLDLLSWEVVHQGKKPVAVLATGYLVTQAKQLCEEKGVTLINARCIKPLDATLLDKVLRENRRIITLEENSQMGGFGSAVAQFLCAGEYQARLTSLGLPDEFISHGDQQTVRKRCGIDLDSLKLTFKELNI